MAPTTLKTTYKPSKVLQSFYTGGKVALSKNGRILVTTLEEDAVITDMHNGRELARIEGDTEVLTTLALTPKATHLITCSRSFSMRIYSLQHDESLTFMKVTLLRTLKAHEAPIITCAIDSTGTLLATGGSEGLVKVWDIKGGYVTHNFRGHGGVISALSFYVPANGNAKDWKLASGADDTKIFIWDLYQRKAIKTLESHNSVVRGLDWSVDGTSVVSAGRDSVICLWDTKTWKLRGTIPALEVLECTGFLSLGFDVGQGNDETSQVIYSGGERGGVRLWNSRTGKEIVSEKAADEDEINDIIYQKGTSSILVVHNDQTLLVHDLASGIPIIRRLSGHHDEIIDLQYITNIDSLLAIATNSEDIRIIAVEENSFGDVGVLKGHSDIVICLDKDVSGCWLASGGKDNEARLWRIDADNKDEKKRFTSYARFTGHAESIGAVSLPRLSDSSDLSNPPSFLITGSKDRTIKRWAIPNTKSKSQVPKAVYTRKAHDKDINSIDVSPDDSLFATASQDKMIKVWSVETGETLGILKGHRRGVWSVRFGPTSATSSTIGSTGSAKLLVSASGDKTVRLWNLSDYSCIKTFEGHSGIVLKCVWLSGGLQIASAGGEGLIKVWDARSGECTTTLDGHEDKVWGLVSRRDEKVIVSGGGDSVITFWDDVSEETKILQAKEEEELVEQEQKLANYIHTADYTSAIHLALQLNHPHRLLTLLTTILSTPSHLRDLQSITGLLSVDAVLANLDDDQLYTLLTRIRDWNTNTRTVAVAQTVLNLIMRAYDVSRLVDMAGKRSGESGKTENGDGNGGKGRKSRGDGMTVKEIVEVVERYTEKHYVRVDELVAETYLVEYTLREMEESAYVDERMVAEDRDHAETTTGTTTPITNTITDADTNRGNSINGHNHETQTIDDDVVMV